MNYSAKRKKNFPTHALTDFPTKKDGSLYNAIYSGGSVFVINSTDVWNLYYNGNFGKGSLSKSSPYFSSRKGDIPEFITESQWERRQSWMKNFRSEQKENDVSVRISGYDKFRLIEMEKSIDNFLRSTHNFDSECWKKWKTEKRTIEMEKLPIQVCRKLDIPNAGNEDDAEFSRNWMKELNEEHWVSSDDLIANSEELKNLQFIVERKIKGMGNDGVCQKSNKKDLVVVMPDLTKNMSVDDIICNSRFEEETVSTVNEELVLSLEEAFFLNFALGCLQIKNTEGEILNTNDLWLEFRNSNDQFIERYVAYHYYRSKGWVVRSGLKYGGDFILYKKGPSFYHGSYVVVLERIYEENYGRKNSLSWNKLIGLNRMLSSANKELILCGVVWPKDSKEDDLLSHCCLSKFTVMETFPKRWVPSQERKK